jgi:ABC-2 type transport system permease protein
MAIYSPRFADYVIRVSATAQPARPGHDIRPFRAGSRQQALRRKEFVLLRRDATAIQLWFRVQARRSQFRRRQTSSRLATFAEAFSSIGWAATAALALAWPSVAVVTGLMTAGMLAATWKISPDRG